MATTTNYSWITPDDTALVKDGAAAIRSLGSSIDTTTKALNPSTTLGDIEYRSATANTNTRLGIGTTGQVLSVSAGVPAWTTLASGGKNFSLLNTGGTTLSGSSTTISGISGKDSLYIFWERAANDTGQVGINIRFNGDTTTQMPYFGLILNQTATYGVTTLSSIADSNAGRVPVGRFTTSTGSRASGGMSVEGANTSGDKVFQITGGADEFGSATTGALNYVTSGNWSNSATISSVSLFLSSGNFTGGKIYVYGA